MKLSALPLPLMFLRLGGQRHRFLRRTTTVGIALLTAFSILFAALPVLFNAQVKAAGEVTWGTGTGVLASWSSKDYAAHGAVVNADGSVTAQARDDFFLQNMGFSDDQKAAIANAGTTQCYIKYIIEIDHFTNDHVAGEFGYWDGIGPNERFGTYRSLTPGGRDTNNWDWFILQGKWVSIVQKSFTANQVNTGASLEFKSFFSANVLKFGGKVVISTDPTPLPVPDGYAAGDLDANYGYSNVWDAGTGVVQAFDTVQDSGRDGNNHANFDIGATRVMTDRGLTANADGTFTYKPSTKDFFLYGYHWNSTATTALQSGGDFYFKFTIKVQGLKATSDAGTLTKGDGQDEFWYWQTNSEAIVGPRVGPHQKVLDSDAQATDWQWWYDHEGQWVSIVQKIHVDPNTRDWLGDIGFNNFLYNATGGTLQYTIGGKIVLSTDATPLTVPYYTSDYSFSPSQPGNANRPGVHDELFLSKGNGPTEAFWSYGVFADNTNTIVAALPIDNSQPKAHLNLQVSGDYDLSVSYFGPDSGFQKICDSTSGRNLISIDVHGKSKVWVKLADRTPDNGGGPNFHSGFVTYGDNYFGNMNSAQIAWQGHADNYKSYVFGDGGLDEDSTHMWADGAHWISFGYPLNLAADKQYLVMQVGGDNMRILVSTTGPNMANATKYTAADVHDGKLTVDLTSALNAAKTAGKKPSEAYVWFRMDNATYWQDNTLTPTTTGQVAGNGAAMWWFQVTNSVDTTTPPDDDNGPFPANGQDNQAYGFGYGSDDTYLQAGSNFNHNDAWLGTERRFGGDGSQLIYKLPLYQQATEAHVALSIHGTSKVYTSKNGTDWTLACSNTTTTQPVVDLTSFIARGWAWIKITGNGGDACFTYAQVDYNNHFDTGVTLSDVTNGDTPIAALTRYVYNVPNGGPAGLGPDQPDQWFWDNSNAARFEVPLNTAIGSSDKQVLRLTVGGGRLGVFVADNIDFKNATRYTSNNVTNGVLEINVTSLIRAGKKSVFFQVCNTTWWNDATADGLASNSTGTNGGGGVLFAFAAMTNPAPIDNGSSTPSSQSSSSNSNTSSIVVSTPASSDTQQAVGTVKGRLIDKSGNALANYSVLLDGTMVAITDDNGYFEFSNVSLGTHHLSVLDESGQQFSSSSDITVSANGQTINLTATFDGTTLKVSGIASQVPTGDNTSSAVLIALLVAAAAVSAVVLLQKKAAVAH